MRIRKGKLDMRVKFMNFVGLIGGGALMASSWNRKLKWNKNDKIGWLGMATGTFCLINSIKSIMDNNFVPEKQDTTPSMKEVSKESIVKEE